MCAILLSIFWWKPPIVKIIYYAHLNYIFLLFYKLYTYVTITQKSFSMIILLLPFYQSDTALWYCVHAILGFMCEFFSYQDLLKPSEWPSTTFIEEQLFPISVWFSLLGGLPVWRVDLKTLPVWHSHYLCISMWQRTCEPSGILLCGVPLCCIPPSCIPPCDIPPWGISLFCITPCVSYGVPLCCIPPCGICPCVISLCGSSPSLCTVVWRLLRRPRCGAPQM